MINAPSLLSKYSFYTVCSIKSFRKYIVKMQHLINRNINISCNIRLYVCAIYIYNNNF